MNADGVNRVQGDYRIQVHCSGTKGSILSSAGICVDVFYDVEAYGHGGHGYCPSSPERPGLQLWECVVIHHVQPLSIQLDMPAKT